MQHRRDISLLHEVSAPIRISPFVSEVVFKNIIGKLMRPLVETVHVQGCVRALHMQATLCDPVLLASYAEATKRMGSLGTICSGVRRFTKTLLDMVVGTIESSFLGSTPRLVVLQQ